MSVYYLLQESGSRITLENGTGFLLLEESTPSTAIYPGHAGGLRMPERLREDEDGVAAALALLLT